jgi:hypothetical protein
VLAESESSHFEESFDNPRRAGTRDWADDPGGFIALRKLRAAAESGFEMAR